MNGGRIIGVLFTRLFSKGLVLVASYLSKLIYVGRPERFRDELRIFMRIESTPIPLSLLLYVCIY